MSDKNLFHSLKVERKIKETPEAISLVFRIPQHLQSQYQYTPGQFVKLQVHTAGETLARSYSIASCPGWDTEFKVTVKKVFKGRVSSFLVDHLQQGDSILVRPPRGRFVLPTPVPPQIIFVAAGSGITPIMSMLKHAWLQNCNISLLYANRNESSVIYKNELEQMQKNLQSHNKPPKNFYLQYHFSSQQGRLSTPQLDSFFRQHDPRNQAHYFFCGPVPLMKNAREILKARIPHSHLHHESFGQGGLRPSTSRVEAAGNTSDKSRDSKLGNTSPISRTEDAGDTGDRARDSQPKIHIGPGAQAPCAAQLQVQLDGKNIQIQCQAGESILEALLREGHNPPYSCTEGACMACMGTLTQGHVHQNDMGILVDENIQQHECLTCQARPLSPHVQLRYM